MHTSCQFCLIVEEQAMPELSTMQLPVPIFSALSKSRWRS